MIFGTKKWTFATLCMQPKAFLAGIRLIMVMLLCILMHCIVAEEDGKASTLSLLLVMFALKRCIKLFTKIQVGSLKLRCSIVLVSKIFVCNKFTMSKDLQSLLRIFRTINECSMEIIQCRLKRDIISVKLQNCFLRST